MPENLLADVLRFIGVRESLARRSVRDPKMPREPANIVLRHGDPRMTAAVAWTFVAIKTHGSIMWWRRLNSTSFQLHEWEESRLFGQAPPAW
jgi:hypothetical protein